MSFSSIGNEYVFPNLFILRFFVDTDKVVTIAAAGENDRGKLTYVSYNIIIYNILIYRHNLLRQAHISLKGNCNVT